MHGQGGMRANERGGASSLGAGVGDGQGGCQVVHVLHELHAVASGWR